MHSTIIMKQRTGNAHEMEKLQYIWMEDHIPKPTPCLFTVQMTASLFQTLKERAGVICNQEFVASTGRFK